MHLSDNELKGIIGGEGVSIWALLAGLGALIFGSGVFDGYVRPTGCRSSK